MQPLSAILTQVKQATPWSPPAYPDPLDPQWEQAFKKAASLMEKENLARAWLWSLTAPQFQSEKKELNVALATVLETQRSFIKKVRPFLKEADFTAEQLGVLRPVLQTALAVPKNRVRLIAYHLWFGTASERLAAIQLLVEPAPYGPLLREHPLLANRVWDASRHKMAQVSHMGIANWMCVYMGMECMALPVLSRPGMMHWHTLGAGADTAFGPTARTIDQLRAARAYVSQEQPELVLPTFVRLLVEIEQFYLPAYHLTEFTPATKNERFTPALAYSVLRAWLPQCITTWDSAECLGVTWQEACTIALTSSATAPTYAPLPDSLLNDR